MDEWCTGLVLEDNHFGVCPGESILVYRDLGHRHLTDFALDFGIASHLQIDIFANLHTTIVDDVLVIITCNMVFLEGDPLSLSALVTAPLLNMA